MTTYESCRFFRQTIKIVVVSIFALGFVGCTHIFDGEEVAFVKRSHKNSPFPESHTDPETLWVKVFPSDQRVVLNNGVPRSLENTENPEGSTGAYCEVYSSELWECRYWNLTPPDGRIPGSRLLEILEVSNDTLEQRRGNRLYGGVLGSRPQTFLPEEEKVFVRLTRFERLGVFLKRFVKTMKSG